MAQRGLLLVIACIIEIAAVGGSVDAHAQSMGTPGIAVAVLGPVVVVGAGLDGDVLVQLLAGCGADHVDQAMHRVGAIHCGGRALDDLDAPGLLGVGVEQLVDVAETGSPQADAVAGDQEGAATAGPCEHRRAQRDKAFLAVTPGDPGTGHLLHGLADMGMADQLEVLLADAGPVQGQLHTVLGHPRGGDQYLFRRGSPGCDQ